MTDAEHAPASRLSYPPFVGPTDKAAHFQRHPIKGQDELRFACCHALIRNGHDFDCPER